MLETTTTALGERQSAAASPAQGPTDSFRETVESVVVAFVLAFLFRTFAAEPFVIPTGSMAPTLMGRHKDLVCPKCGYGYTVNAADEVDRDSGARLANVNVAGCTCPMCRYPLSLEEVARAGGHATSYNGDRILASKFPGQMADPERWDVIVFRFPSKSKDNYIKRLVGLPGEEVQLERGDVFVRPVDRADQPFRIARKSPEKVLAMMQVVHDNDFASREALEAGWPPRWQAAEAGDGSWRAGGDGQWFRLEQTSQPRWLRYRHFPPSEADWRKIEEGRRIEVPPRPQFITDFYAYNTPRFHPGESLSNDMLGLRWVGDLILECTLTPDAPRGSATLELVEGGVRLSTHLDLASGEARLAIEGRSDFAPRGPTSLGDGRAHRLRFANVDDQMILWVDDEQVVFDGPTVYDDLGNHRPQEADLSPVGIAVAGAAVEVSQLRVLRDVYYLAAPRGGHSVQPGYVGGMRNSEVGRILSDPEAWRLLEHAPRTFVMRDDEFLFLGDNSPESFDGRLWLEGHVVRRELLIGKALLVYWPHAWETPLSFELPRTETRFPFFPNFRRMRVIH